MVAVRNIAAISASSIFILLAGCVATGGGLVSSADRLERNADVLARDARYDSTDSYSRDARALAQQADDFRRIVYDRRADGRDVRAAFEELSRDYHALRDEVDRSASSELRADFKPVTEAYLDIEREMSQHADSRRYARDRDEVRRDRY